MITVAKFGLLLGGILISLAACASTEGSLDSSNVVACVSESAEQGTSVSGMLGAVWADLDGDGCTDGYVWNGRYHQGAPERPAVHRIEYQAVDLDLVEMEMGIATADR